MASPSPQPIQGKGAIVKRCDGEPLTRVDLQYDLLASIFASPQAVFTDANPTIHGDPPKTKVTFHDLYVNAIVRSPRASKQLRDKMQESSDFATDFAKLALLVNVGRINTTMAFFPELRTALRTFHPLPSLQRTDGNFQDVPRIKNILKSSLLEGEEEPTPTTPHEILALSRSGRDPPTSITNLIFILAGHASYLAQIHFETPIDILDLFGPINVSSSSRAQAFLWLCFHYLDPSSPNPFADEFAQRNPGKLPLLKVITQDEMDAENVDTENEKQLVDRMIAQRLDFQERKNRGRSIVDLGGGKGRGKRAFKDAGTRLILPLMKDRDTPPPSHWEVPTQQYQMSKFHLRNANTSESSSWPSRSHHESEHRAPSPPRTMVQHAWHVVTFSDPLVESDEEFADEHVRLDYTRRLQVISRLRGKGPTPEPEDPPS